MELLLRKTKGRQGDHLDIEQKTVGLVQCQDPTSFLQEMDMGKKQIEIKKKKFLLTYGVILSLTYLIWVTVVILFSSQTEDLFGEEINTWLAAPVIPPLVIAEGLGVRIEKAILFYYLGFGFVFYFILGVVVARIILWRREKKQKQHQVVTVDR